MQSRLNKYQEEKADSKYERSKKNTKLYEEVYDDLYKDTKYKNMSIIDSAKEIDISKLKNMIDDKYDTRQYRTFKNYSVDDIEEKPIYTNQKEIVHDINEIISEAKSKRAFIEEAKEKQKYTNFTEKRNQKYEEMEKEEKELEELINTMAIPKVDPDTDEALDMFDLKGEENTIVTTPIEASFDTEIQDTTTTTDIKKKIDKADKTFYTDSNMFTKNDFEDFNTLSKEIAKKRSNKKIILIIIVLLILAVIAYLILTKYVINK